MLTLMLMVQMSKHVKMQSHKTLVQNKLIISTDNGVLSGEDSAQGVQWGLWSASVKVWSVKVWSLKCRV